MSVLSVIQNAGVQASIDNTGGLKLKGLSRLTIEQKSQIIEYARTHKPAIIAALSQSSPPGDCESCPAAGYWDHIYYAGKLLCFEHAFFRGKPGKPRPCGEMRQNCPRSKEPF